MLIHWVIRLAVFICCCCPLISTGQFFASRTNSDLSNLGVKIVSFEFLTQPELLSDHWGTEPIPLRYYNSRMIEQQRNINDKAHFIVTSESGSTHIDWTLVDEDEITPLTWKWIDLEMRHANGDTTLISLRRPNWWILENKVDQKGSTLFLNMPEMGIQDQAEVLAVRPIQLDSRFIDEDESGRHLRPVTGKFTHTSNEVYDLHFEGTGETLGVTLNHLIWSVDKKKWKPVGELVKGERVKTLTGELSVSGKSIRPGKHLVYNLEVYRDHHYHVGELELMAHNEKPVDLDNLPNPMSAVNDIGPLPQLFSETIQVSEKVSLMRAVTYPWHRVNLFEVIDNALAKARKENADFIALEIRPAIDDFMNGMDELIEAARKRESYKGLNISFRESREMNQYELLLEGRVLKAVK